MSYRPLLLLLTALELLSGASHAGDVGVTGSYGEDFVPAPGDLLIVKNTSAAGMRIETLRFVLTGGVVFDPEQEGGVGGEVIDEVGSSGFDGTFDYGDPFFQPLPDPRTVYSSLVLSFSDFEPGEEVYILLDVDGGQGTEAFVDGPTFAGSELEVTFANAFVDLAVAGTYTPFGVEATIAIADTLSLPSTVTSRNGLVPNPDVFSSGAVPPAVGNVWSPTVDHTAFEPFAVADFLVFSFSPTDVDLGSLGSLLCFPWVGPAILNPTPADPFAVPLPDVCGLIGAPLCTQAGSFDGIDVRFTNALDVTIGTS